MSLLQFFFIMAGFGSVSYTLLKIYGVLHQILMEIERR